MFINFIIFLYFINLVLCKASDTIKININNITKSSIVPNNFVGYSIEWSHIRDVINNKQLIKNLINNTIILFY